MLRHIAKNLVANGYAKKCEIQISYSIGVEEPISTHVNTFGTGTKSEEELNKLEDAIAFRNVSNMPARVKCALLAWHTLEDMLNKNDENGKGTINCCH